MLIRTLLSTALVTCMWALPALGQGDPGCDLDVTYVQLAPAWDYDATPNRPRRDGWVVWRAFVRNRGSSNTGAFDYRWTVDGQVVREGTRRSIPTGGSTRISLLARYRPGQQIRFEVDPAGRVTESSEGNNARELRSNALMVGLWVEESVRAYFDAHQLEYQRQFGIDDGANSFEDWAQRQIAVWNRMLAEAIYPSAPHGGLDRVRLQKVVVVPDGSLPLNGGVPTNHPDVTDKTVDMMWGLPAPIDPAFHDRLRGDSAFNVEPSLIHELQHARFLVDAYGLNVHGHQIGVRDRSGARIFVDDYDLVRSASARGLMNGTTCTFSEWSVAWLNVYAGRRPLPGWANYNAHAGISSYMLRRGMRMPRENILRVVDSDGASVAGATVLVYQAQPRPGAYCDKWIDDVPDMVLETDHYGCVRLGRNPFGPGLVEVNSTEVHAGVDFIRILHGDREDHAWLDLAQVQVAHFRSQRARWGLRRRYRGIRLREGPWEVAVHEVKLP